MAAYTIKENKQDKVLSLVLTLLIHGLILLFLILYIIITPIPPYPEPAAPEFQLDFGGGGGGSGQTASVNTGKTGTTQNIKAPETNTPTVNNDVEATTPVPSNKAKHEPKKIDTVPRPQQPSLELASAENKFKSAKGGNGNGNAANGQQGSGGNGNGTSSGNGNGPGQGPGPGGNGNGWTLQGRNLQYRPEVTNIKNIQGKIVVDITVDIDGNVTNATPGVAGTTITDGSLYILVKNAALKIKFDKSPTKTPEQYGTVTFVF